MTAPQPALARPWWHAPGLRVALYAAMLVALGSWVCFHKLGRGMLIDDESVFGVTTDIMLETGDYIVPRIDNGRPHPNGTPLYNWLCCLTADVFPDSPLRYRAWSAVFAVFCAVAVLLLGTELFRPEVGFLAGVLLLTNHYFVFHHGARSGVMEPGLMTFLVLMVYSYARSWRPESSPGMCWAMVGVCLGGAVMMKPPTFGGFFFTLLGFHHLVTRRDLPLSARVKQPLLALGVGTLVALPWYALMIDRNGWVTLKQLFYNNSVNRLVAPARLNYAPPPRSIYFDFVGASSEAARLFWPALGVAAAFSLLGWLRSRWGLLAFLAAAYYAALTSAEIKNPHYAHFGLPFLCLLTAAVLLAGWLPPPGWVANPAAGRWAWRGLAIAGVAWAAVLVHADVQRLREQFHAPTWDYPPLVVHRKVQPLLEAGHAHFVLYGEYPRCRERTNLKLGFWSIDQFYRPRLVGAEHAATAAELNRVLADGKPAVVFLPPKQPLTDLVPAGLAYQPDRALRLRSERLYYRVLLFHGAEAHLGLAEFFLANEVPPGEPDRF